MVASRDTVLDTIAEAAANSDDFFNERVASNNSLTLEIKLVQDLPTSRLYMVTLAALVSSPQIAEATVDANIELKLLEHTKLLVQLFAENRQMGFYDVVSLLLGRKADINATNSIGQTPLLLAAKDGHEQIVQLLLEQGADHKIADKRLGMTPLAAAAANGHSGTVALLLDKGADVDARNKKRETAVFDSIRASSLTTIQLLLNHNANVNAAHSGRTPFFCAIQETNLEAVELLIAHGASTLEKNTLGELPLQYAKRLTNPPNEAARQRRHQILRVLEAHNDYNAVETAKAADLSAAEDGKSVKYGAQELPDTTSGTTVAKAVFQGHYL
ncbi:hypothetical protein K456DRAFT_1729013 [Colletotrichum gloeosporioides 23]|nr:hypothetical protein K456DRAFT_1729013 [Colletotrichum gloeosporioides 23]